MARYRRDDDKRLSAILAGTAVGSRLDTLSISIAVAVCPGSYSLHIEKGEESEWLMIGFGDSGTYTKLLEAKAIPDQGGASLASYLVDAPRASKLFPWGGKYYRSSPPPPLPDETSGRSTFWVAMWLLGVGVIGGVVILARIRFSKPRPSQQVR
jgi:hypothetical protein